MAITSEFMMGHSNQVLGSPTERLTGLMSPRYHCEKCNKKVAAIKRASIHTLPPNLILHLKRLDFDLELFIRVKLNDHIEFPHELNMLPYTLDHLSPARYVRALLCAPFAWRETNKITRFFYFGLF